MQLKPNHTYTYQDRTITIYENGKPIVRQPFDSDNGKSFESEEQAMAWAQRCFPHVFVD